MNARLPLALALTVWIAVAAAGCQSRSGLVAPAQVPHAESANTTVQQQQVELASEPGEAAPTNEAPEPAPTGLSELREVHNQAAAGEGASCEDDRDCLSPLRCADHACFWPPAMRGARDEAPMIAVFEGAVSGSETKYLELARQPWEVMRGLMDRRSMSPGMGMVFDFGNEDYRSFWMRNTYIPLDMIFVAANGRVVTLHEWTEPLTLESRRSTERARYVIELNGGEAEASGIRVGSQVSIRRSGEQAQPGAE